MEQRTRLTDMVKALPVAHQVVIGIAGLVLLMAGYLFFNWVSTPSYTVLYTGLDDTTLSSVVDELEQQGVAYRIEAGGNRVLVPKSQVYKVRADLAAAGVRSGAAPQGYELLDGQGLNVSDFRQRIDYQRALEGELARTLLAMNDISAATVHLVIPEETLFVADEEPVTASVLIDSNRTLGELEVETITFLVASSVEGLEATNVTVADVEGQVLHAAGEISAGAAVSNRNLRMTRDFEASLSTDVRNLLATVVGANSASVVVRAQLDFDEESVESETYDPDSATALREQTIDEQFIGAGVPPGGTLGVDGAPIETEDGEEYTYDRSEVIREYGVDRVISRTVTAPGRVNQLSVAVVIDDGSLTGAPTPPVTEIENLVTAAVGLDTNRGDSISISAVAFPAADEATEDTEAAAAGGLDPLSMIPQAIGGLVMLVVAIALFLMTRGGKKAGPELALEATPAALPGGERGADRELVGAAVGDAIHPEVMSLVQKQPEEIAVLLRSWLADRR
jgi:flagellar M-ring protein FliF